MGRRRGGSIFPRLVSCLLFAVTSVTASPSEAQERAPLIALEWSAPEGCPVHDEVVSRVEERVGPTRPRGRVLSARGQVTVSKTTPRFHLQLGLVGDETSARSLSGDDCSHLVDAAAIILALDIDSVLARSEASPTTEQGPRLEPPSPLTPTRAVPSPSAPVPPRPHASARPPKPPKLEVRGGARLTVDDGSLPRTTLGVGPALSVARGHLSMDLRGIFFGERFTVDGPRGGRAGAYVGSTVAAAHACLRESSFGLEWRGCLGGELALVSTTGVGLARSSSSTGAQGALSALVDARLEGRRFSPTAGLSVVVPVDPPPVLVDGFGTIFTPSSVGLRAFLGVDVNFL